MKIKTISLAHQTNVADLIEKSIDAGFNDQFPENGSFTRLTKSGRAYWYYLGYEPQKDGPAKRYSKYVGPADDESIARRVEDFGTRKQQYRERRDLVRSLKSIGLPSPTSFVGDVIEALWKAGLFRVRGVLVGTQAFQAYALLLGVKLPSASVSTVDVDFAQFHSVSGAIEDGMDPVLPALQSVDSTFKPIPHRSDKIACTAFMNNEGFKVEFLTPNRGKDEYQDHPAAMPALGGAAAQPLRYLDFLIAHPVNAVLLHKGGIHVRVPAPERYAIHKMIISSQRSDSPNGSIKAAKDALQAGILIDAMSQRRQGYDLGGAWCEAWSRGPQWQKSLKIGLTRLSSDQQDSLSAAVGEYCSADGLNAADFGLGIAGDISNGTT